MTRVVLLALPLLIAATATASIRGGGMYSLSWDSIDGGTSVASGDDYWIAGTIGQPDAGAPMTGGDYSFVGGFWSQATDVAVPPPCPADLDGSGLVDVADLLDLLAAWGTCSNPCPADLDGSGTVDVGDLLVLLAAWGAC